MNSRAPINQEAGSWKNPDPDENSDSKPSLTASIPPTTTIASHAMDTAEPRDGLNDAHSMSVAPMAADSKKSESEARHVID